MTKTKYTDRVYAIYPKSGSGYAVKTKYGEAANNPYREVKGFVETPHRYVYVFSWLWENRHQSSHIQIIKNGRNYIRNFNKGFSARGLTTKAKQFAAEIFANE